MVTFTDGAKAHVVAFLAEESEPLAVRIEVLDSSPLAPQYDLALIEESEKEAGDQIYEQGGFEVVVPRSSVDLLKGATVDWVESMQGSGFKVENPNIVPIGQGLADGPLADRVKQVIDMQVNPAIASHGGSVGLVEVREDVVYLEMMGGCQGCGMAAATLAQGIRRIIMENVPDVKDIVDVTNHEAGVNPYY
ncbi:MAG: iron-sulfur cluster assembly accessory protein [marine benthic group bacterium]|nr:iron-sulfur cluster assembly accessory protein [Gemmatimonadota bacterium]